MSNVEVQTPDVEIGLKKVQQQIQEVLECYVRELPLHPTGGAETHLTSKPAEATASKARLEQQLVNGSAFQTGHQPIEGERKSTALA